MKITSVYYDFCAHYCIVVPGNSKLDRKDRRVFHPESGSREREEGFSPGPRATSRRHGRSGETSPQISPAANTEAGKVSQQSALIEDPVQFIASMLDSS